jgi:hypothetical protein
MSKLKTIGRNVRRLRKQIAAMDPKKVYRVEDGKNAITLTGAQWKASTKSHVEKEAEDLQDGPQKPEAQTETQGIEAVH